MTNEPSKGVGRGALTHGSRKGLGGDRPTGAVAPMRAVRRSSDDITRAQVSEMESEGQGQQNQPVAEAPPAPTPEPRRRS